MAEMLFDPEPDPDDVESTGEPVGSSPVDDLVAALGRVDDLDAEGVLAQAEVGQRMVNLAQAMQLKLAARWADLNAELEPGQSAGLPGMERLVELGGQGTPCVAEFAPAELAAQFGLSPVAGSYLVADALDLRHRLPRLWTRVCAGDVRPGLARWVAQESRELSQAAAAVVDVLGHRQVTLRPVIELNRPMRAADCYEVPADIAEAVQLRSPADCFPHATSTSRRRGDLDHTIPYLAPDDGGPPGQTRLDNLGRLSRPQHRIKTFGEWKVKQLRSGVWIWTSPHRYHYLVDHTGTIALGKL